MRKNIFIPGERAVRAALWMLIVAFGVNAALGQSQKWRFVVFGDSRGTSATDQINTNILSELARATTNMSPRPAFVLVPGDLVNSGNLEAFQAWTNIMAPVYQAGIGVYPVMGNHDDDDVNAFKTVFGPSLPDNGPAGETDRTYLIAHSNVLVLALDTYVNAHRVNTNWVAAVLATNTSSHVFAMGHDPAFKANHADCLDDYPASRDFFWNSLHNAGGRIYFAGHDHFYDHLRLEDQDGNANNDVHQIIVGTAGAPLNSSYAHDGENSIWTPAPIFHEKTNGYVVAEIDGYNVTSTWYRRIGADAYVATSDVFAYTVAPRITSNYSNGRVALMWPGDGLLQSAPDATGPWTALTDAASPWAITNFAMASEFYRVRGR